MRTFPSLLDWFPAMLDLDMELLTLMASHAEKQVVFWAEGVLFHTSLGYVCDMCSLGFADFIISNQKLGLQPVQQV